MADAPATVQVWQGAVVEWHNTEAGADALHSSTSDLDARTASAGWDSGLLGRDETYRRRFDSLGTFTYHDVENPNMVGSVQVCHRTDVDCSGAVDVLDLVAAAQQWGNGFDSRYDIDGDGLMTVGDIVSIAADFGWIVP